MILRLVGHKSYLENMFLECYIVRFHAFFFTFRLLVILGFFLISILI